MEFHVWGKLDDTGRVESFQSRCTTPAFQDNGASYWNRDMGHVTTGANGEKLVDYQVKKDLMNKLDAKVDEMSLIMMQMGELSKRVKIQEKLIGEYEQKAARQDQLIQRLEAENAALRRAHPGMMTSSRSLSSGNLPSAATQSKSVRSSVTEIKMTCSVHCSTSRDGQQSSWPLASGTNSFSGLDANDPLFKDVHESLRHTSCDKASCDKIEGESGKRPDSLTLPYPENIGDSVNESTPNAHEESVDTVDGYLMYSPEDCETGANHHQCDHQPLETVSPAACDKDGYLILSGSSSSNRSESTPSRECSCQSFDDISLDSSYPVSPCSSRRLSSCSDGSVTFSTPSQSAEDSSSRLGSNRRLVMECEDGIHGRWLTGLEFKISCSSQRGSSHQEDQLLNNSDCAEENENEYSYVEIPPDCVSGMEHTTPEYQDSVNDAAVNENQDPDKYSSRPPLATPPPRPKRRHEFKVKVETDCSQRYLHTAPTKEALSDPFQGLLVEGVMPQVQTFTRYRQQSPDRRKDDHCNNILKTMRTTMEWNKAKRTLMSMSHTCTVDQAEQTLRLLVQDSYMAYKKLQSQDRKKLERCCTERLVKMVRREVKNSKGNEILTDAFLQKCVHLFTTHEKTASS